MDIPLEGAAVVGWRALWLLLPLTMLTGEAQSANGPQQSYQLADRGTLVLSVPSTWTERVGRRDALTPPTIAYRPQSGQPFDIRVTPIWAFSERMSMPTLPQMKANVQSAADSVKSRAVEKAIVPSELKGSSAQGYYFSVTDRAPKAGEFRFMTQGMLVLGEIQVAFTILTNDGQDDVVKQALEMLRNARLEPPKQAAPTTAAGTAPPPPDVDALQALLRTGDYAKLDAALSSYQSAYRGGAINDETAAAAFIALKDNDPDLREHYDAWVAALPESYVARIARGYYLMRLGYLARGKEYAGKTAQVRMQDMRNYFKLAMADLERSLQLDPRPTLAYGTMISIAQSVGAQESTAKYLDAAVGLDPRVYTARASYFASLRPEWGGSLEQMEQALAAWKSTLEQAQWRRLESRLQDARWRARLEPAARMVKSGQCPQAIAEYTKALEQATVLRAHAMRGTCYVQLGQFDKALEDFARVLSIDPDGGCCTGTRANLANALLKLGRKEEALAELRLAAENDDEWANRELARTYAFGRHGVKRDYVMARKYCERSAKQGDALSMYCIGGIYHAGLGVPKDLPLAAYWFASAGLRGVADAQADIGTMAWQGQGMPQNRRHAAQWWRMAAAQGNKRAAASLRQHGFHWSYFRYVTLRNWLGGK